MLDGNPALFSVLYADAARHVLTKPVTPIIHNIPLMYIAVLDQQKFTFPSDAFVQLLKAILVFQFELLQRGSVDGWQAL